MLSSRVHSSLALRRCTRSFATESLRSADSANSIPPPPPSKPSAQKSRTRLSLAPRPSGSFSQQSLINLPPTFGRNQLLSVSDSRRALLESIVAEFEAPIRYAFAYGSGVFEQEGYQSTPANESPMLDFIFAVTHPSHFHSINMNQHPGHYAFHARLLGSSFVTEVQTVAPGLWFNAFVPAKGVTIKYGVTTVDNLCSDLLNWNTLYLAGRMHKPLRIIKDDARVRLTQQVNLTSAVRTALLTLPAEFNETALFEAIAGISYSGDPRMLLPAENRGKVANIVRKQAPQFRELYHRLVVGLPGVHWPAGASTVQQDVGANARAAHLKKLPSALLARVKSQYTNISDVDEGSTAYWQKMAGDERLPQIITNELKYTVRGPATMQTLKGLVSSGPAQSLRYTTEKVGKWWAGRKQQQEQP